MVLGGSLNGDVIIASQEALALVRAGKLARAFVIAGLETLRRIVPLHGGRSLSVDFGIYRLISNAAPRSDAP